MFFRKAKKIQDLEEQLKTAYGEAYSKDSNVCILWSTRYELLDAMVKKQDVKMKLLVRENKQLKRGLKAARNKMAHYVLELGRLMTKVKGHQYELTEGFDL